MVKKIKKALRYFSKGELILWLCSLLAIVLSFLLFDRKNFLMPIASLIGATSLIFNANGNPFGQVLMIIFSLLYGIISYTFAYAFNDVVLIILWSLVTKTNPSYLSVVICFIAFLINDVYDLSVGKKCKKSKKKQISRPIRRLIPLYYLF